MIHEEMEEAIKVLVEQEEWNIKHIQKLEETMAGINKVLIEFQKYLKDKL